MRLRTWLALSALLLWTGCGDDADTDGDKGSKAPDTAQVSEALITGVSFKSGELVKGSIPAVSAQTVMLAQDDDVVRLLPGEAALMALEVENPDEGDDPVESILLQFEESDDHIEVTRETPDGGAADPSHIEIGFDVSDAICERLCNLIYEVSMNQAVKLASGGVSRKLARVFALDCTDDGDPKLCAEDEPKDAGTSGGNAGRGGDTGSTGTTTAARELRSALNAANTTACMCAGTTGSSCEDARFDGAAISCIETSVQENAELVGAASCLGNRVRSVASGCSCDMTCLDDVVPTALGMCTGVDAIKTALEACEFVTE